MDASQGQDQREQHFCKYDSYCIVLVCFGAFVL